MAGESEESRSRGDGGDGVDGGGGRALWGIRIILLVALALAGVGLLALDGSRPEPATLGILAGAALLALLGLVVFRHRRPSLGRGVALGLGAAAVGFASVRMLGPAFAPAAALGAPLVALAGASIGGFGPFLVADALTLGWALSLGLASGGLWPAGSLIALEPAASLLHLLMLAFVSNGVALVTTWNLRETSSQAERELRLSRAEQDRLARELAATEPLAAAGRLVANVAHEISNPVQAMDHMLFVLLEETPETDPRRPRLLTVKQAVDRLTQYLEQLSNFYRPPARAGRVDLNRVLGDVFQFLDRQLANANVKVSQEMATGLPPAAIGEEELRQVILNVVLNAVEAMSDGGELEVTTGGDSDSIYAAFQDSGPGIPEADLQRIFEPFFTTKRDQGGSGLGLPISRRILRRHGGELMAHSRPGAGARLVLKVPVAPGRDERGSP